MFWEITTGHATNEQAKSILLLSNIGVHKGRGGVYIATPNLFFLHTSFQPFGPKTPPFCVKQLLEQYTKKLSFYHTDQYAVTFRNCECVKCPPFKLFQSLLPLFFLQNLETCHVISGSIITSIFKKKYKIEFKTALKHNSKSWVSDYGEKEGCRRCIANLRQISSKKTAPFRCPPQRPIRNLLSVPTCDFWRHGFQKAPWI